MQNKGENPKGGGTRLKPGRSYKTVLTEAQVREIFGGIPVARAGYGVIFNLKKLGNDEFEITVIFNP